MTPMMESYDLNRNVKIGTSSSVSQTDMIKNLPNFSQQRKSSLADKQNQKASLVRQESESALTKKKRVISQQGRVIMDTRSGYGSDLSGG